MNAIDPQRLRRELQDLTPMPQVVHDVLAAIVSDEIPVGELAMRIGRDPALAARTLRVANSAFYGAAGRVGTLRDALRVVGVRRIGAVVAASAVAGRFERPRCAGFDFDVFWSHSFATAIGAQAVAARVGLDEGQAFTAGLLHDIGRLVLATRFPEALAAAIEDARRRDGGAYASEASVLGLEHAEVGAAVGEHWRFAAPVVAERFPLERARDAYAAVAAGTLGRVVIDIA